MIDENMNNNNNNNNFKTKLQITGVGKTLYLRSIEFNKIITINLRIFFYDIIFIFYFVSQFMICKT